MKKVNWGIIGPGNIAKTFANAVASSEDNVLYGVASRNVEKATEFAEKYGKVKVFDSYEKLVQDENIHCVYISTINSTHLELIELCGKNNKAVLCEKPCVMTEDDALKVIEINKKYNVLIMEGMWTAFLPTTKKVSQWILENKIGKIRNIDVDFSFYAKKFPGARLFDKALGGGGMYDVGVYTFAYPINLLNKSPEKVSTFLEIGDSGVDEFGTTMMKFEDDIIATCKFGIRLAIPHTAKIFGEDGYIIINSFWNGKGCALYNRDNELIEEFKSGEENGFIYQIEHFAGLFRAGKIESEIMPLWKTRVFAEIYDKANFLN